MNWRAHNIISHRLHSTQYLLYCKYLNWKYKFHCVQSYGIPISHIVVSVHYNGLHLVFTGWLCTRAVLWNRWFQPCWPWSIEQEITARALHGNGQCEYRPMHAKFSRTEVRCITWNSTAFCLPKHWIFVLIWQQTWLHWFCIQNICNFWN